MYFIDILLVYNNYQEQKKDGFNPLMFHNKLYLDYLLFNILRKNLHTTSSFNFSIN
jgi:hypothetical protein